jgi:hypothetical protein
MLYGKDDEAIRIFLKQRFLCLSLATDRYCPVMNLRGFDWIYDVIAHRERYVSFNTGHHVLASEIFCHGSPHPWS